MKIHILGIAGTFMGGIAQLAKAKGFSVSGSDEKIYPPMSTQLEQAKIKVSDLTNINFLKKNVDQIVIGNSMTRGTYAVERVLDSKQYYTSGPQWLAENILHEKWIVAVAGTHGKTTTASMIAWVLEYSKLKPGFLIGGVPENFGVSARLGESIFFVVEADEYDSAFFDKRSKFIHYKPDTCVLNNLEFDHADIFPDLKSIQTQFHHLLRTVPSSGLVIFPADNDAISEVIDMGCWTTKQLSAEYKQDKNALEPIWQFRLLQSDGTEFEVFYKGKSKGNVHWKLRGVHNVKNGLHSIAAALHCGVPIKTSISALAEFKGVKRRLTYFGEVNGIKLYDDFAHHPTAIASTLAGIKQSLLMEKTKNSSSKPKRLIAVFEPRSNTMRMGIHAKSLPKAFDEADLVFCFIDPAWNWQLSKAYFKPLLYISHDYASLLLQLLQVLQAGDEVVFMSNGSFGGIQQQLLSKLTKHF